ncbi:probable flap endonuclease 1 homolog isoform X3 [Poeciliopsis prolifica]|uniref:probable flap endonuclease 1 homolog isoform X3 n=1 Tax=Poeciliopsis prolifica TaxID=188132 RepID=UPI00241390A6|nr:probable flap endonuclease 1 homolog isoform X3 [Poeciliopsis prolifica]
MENLPWKRHLFWRGEQQQLVGAPPKEQEKVHMHKESSAQTKDSIELLKRMGVPVIQDSAFQAAGDAEAQCARLVRDGIVDAVASEDMDTLPFGANILIRQLNAKKDSEVVEYSLPKLLEKLQITHEELVDLCILLGCDYCDKIPGLGPKRALTLIQKHRTIENVVLHINRETYPVPVLWKYEEARKIFLDETQTPAPDLVWSELDEEAVVDFLCHTKHVREERIRHRMKTFHEHRENRREERRKEKAAGCMRQTRMDNFFRVTRKRGQTVESLSSLGDNKKKPRS